MIRIDFQEGIYTGKRKETKIDFKDLSPVLSVAWPLFIKSVFNHGSRRIY